MNLQAIGYGVKLGLLWAASLGFLWVGSVLAGPPEPQDAIAIEILHTADIHGFVKPARDGRGGAGVIADRIARARDKARKDPRYDVVTVDAGDLFGGSPEDILSHGQMMADFAAAVGYDVFTFGNHEFAYGLPTLLGMLNRMRATGTSVLAANVERGTSSVDPSTLCTDAVIINRKGVAIGFVGLALPGLQRNVLEENLPGLTFTETTSPIAQRVARLKSQGAQVVILVSHAGLDSRPYLDDQQIVAEVDGLAAILGAHSHTYLRKPQVDPIHQTLICHVGARGRSMGSLTLFFDAKTKKPLLGGSNGQIEYRYKMMDLASETSRNPLAADLKARYWDPIGALLAQKLADSEVTLGRAFFKTEAPMNNLMADALFEAAGQPDLAISPVSEVRTEIRPGEVRLGDLFTCVPFENEVVRARMTGHELKDLMERVYGEGRRFLAVSNAMVEADSRRPVGERVLSFTIGGQPVDEGRTYLVGTTDFVAQGKGGFGAPGARLEYVGLKLSNREALARYLRKLSRLTDASVKSGRLVDRMLSVEVGRTSRAFGCDPAAGPSVQDLVALSALGRPARGDLALIDGSSIKWSLRDQASVTWRDLMEIVPGEDALVVVEVTGAKVVEIVTALASGKRFPGHLAGASVVARQGAARILIGDSDPQPGATYKLVTTDRVLEGQRGFEALASLAASSRPVGVGLRQAMADWITQMTPIGPEDLPARPALVDDPAVDRAVDRLRKFERLDDAAEQ